MPFFTFDSASVIVKAARYLATFDDTIKFALSCDTREQTLYLTTSNIHPFSYTDFTFRTAATSLLAKRQACEPLRINWAINSDLLVRVLGSFDPRLALTLEMEEDSGYLLLLQLTPDGGTTRVMQIGVIHDLGPSLSVDHGIEKLYRIEDVDGFRQVAKSAALSEEGSCLISLAWEDSERAPKLGGPQGPQVCTLRISTESAKLSVQLGVTERPAEARLEGRVQCSDMETFGLLCEKAQRPRGGSPLHTQTEGEPTRQQLCIGFGENGLSLLRLQWFSPSGEATSNLFFCTS